jgi:hypothetical protein
MWSVKVSFTPASSAYYSPGWRKLAKCAWKVSRSCVSHLRILRQLVQPWKAFSRQSVCISHVGQQRSSVECETYSSSTTRYR